MKNFWILGLMTLSLVGCGEQAELEKLVKSQLRDPESANFKDFIISDKKNRACLIFNAKNGFGGYGAWSIAEFKKSASVWEVRSLDGSKENCSDLGFKAIDAGEQVLVESKLEFIRLIAKLNSISEDEATKVAGKSACSSLVWDYKYAKSRLAELQARRSEGMTEYYEKNIQEALTKLNTSKVCKAQ